MNVYQVMLNGGIGLASLLVVWMIVKHNTALHQVFIKSVIEEMKATTKAVTTLAEEVRRGR